MDSLFTEIQRAELAQRIAQAREKISAAALEVGRRPEEITLVAATKTQPADAVRAAIAFGVAVCGENRVQELTGKLGENAYEGARLHFIGRLQTNKVKYIAGRVELIESVDSARLLDEVERQAAKHSLTQDILLEVNIAEEAGKGGAMAAEVLALARLAAAMPHVRLRGLMCIPPPARRPGENRIYFTASRQLFVDIRNKIEDNNANMDTLSMGMSDDFEDAVREGATLVRLGTALFGPRPPRPEADKP